MSLKVAQSLFQPPSAEFELEAKFNAIVFAGRYSIEDDAGDYSNMGIRHSNVFFLNRPQPPFPFIVRDTASNYRNYRITVIP